VFRETKNNSSYLGVKKAESFCNYLFHSLLSTVVNWYANRKLRLLMGVVREVCKVSMGPREEASADATKDSSSKIDMVHFVINSSLSEKSKRHDVVSNSNSGVNCSSSVRSCDVDHGSKSHSDGHASKVTSILLSMSSKHSFNWVFTD